MSRFTVIFDMDGVIVDNNLYHRQAWNEFCVKHNFFLSESEFKKYVFGRVNKDVLNFLFKRDLALDEFEKYSEEKEFIFRKIYKPFIKLPKGLLSLLEGLKRNDIKMAVASSAPRKNIDFVFKNLDIKKFFSVVLDESQVVNGKPSPEIYLKTSNLLDAKPQQCVVIEDSVSGIKAAVNAGMKVVAITTTHKKQDLKDSDLTIDTFTSLTAEKLAALVAGK